MQNLRKRLEAEQAEKDEITKRAQKAEKELMLLRKSAQAELDSYKEKVGSSSGRT
jgi:hypothetical protein